MAGDEGGGGRRVGGARFRNTSPLRNSLPPQNHGYDPRYGPTVGSWEEGVSDEQGTPVRKVGGSAGGDGGVSERRPAAFFKNVQRVRETDILVEQQPPQGVIVCHHAGLAININYFKGRRCGCRDFGS